MNINVLALAYMGDAIYETYVRDYLIKNNIVKVNELQEESIKYVSARSQAEILKRLIDLRYFSDEELDIIYRARNHKCNHKPKNTDIITYKNATGLEALVGYLYFEKNNDRIDDIMSKVIEMGN